MSKYRVNTEILQGFDKGEIVVAVDCEGSGFPTIPKEHNGIDKKIVERNPEWFEKILEVKEGQYWKWNIFDQVFRIQEVQGERKHIIKYISKDNETQLLGNIIDSARKISGKEVGQALIKEGKRRGYAPNNFKDIDIPSTKVLDIDYQYCGDDVLLLANKICYKQGNWAEIIEDEWEVKHSLQFGYHVKKETPEDVKIESWLNVSKIGSKTEAEAIATALNELD